MIVFQQSQATKNITRSLRGSRKGKNSTRGRRPRETVGTLHMYDCDSEDDAY